MVGRRPHLRHLFKICLSLVLASVLVPCVHAEPGKVVVNWDDWTLSNSGFSPPNDPGVYVQNIARWFLADTGDTVGCFIGYGTDFHLTGDMLEQAFETAGHTWVVSSASTFTLDDLQNYDGVFLGASPLGDDTRNLWSLLYYIAFGGNVYIFGGTNFYGSIANDSAVLNEFLNRFGLAVSSSIDGVVGSITVSGVHEILQGVNFLYGVNGTEVFDLDPMDSRNAVVGSYGTEGIVAVADGISPGVEVPTLSRYGLLVLALVLMAIGFSSFLRGGKRHNYA